MAIVLWYVNNWTLFFSGQLRDFGFAIPGRWIPASMPE